MLADSIRGTKAVVGFETGYTNRSIVCWAGESAVAETLMPSLEKPIYQQWLQDYTSFITDRLAIKTGQTVHHE